MKNHYIIAKQPTNAGTQLIFGKVTSESKGILMGYQEKNSHIDTLKLTFEVPQKAVVLDLGEEPHPGSVYGFDTTNRFYKRKSHPYFGDINFFYKPNKEVAQKIFAAFDKAAEILKKHKLNVPRNQSVWQIMPPKAKGKWAGCYIHSTKPEKNPHRFSIKPESMEQVWWVYVILHEYAHYLHATALTGTKLNAAWLKIFNTSIKLQTIKKEFSSNLLENLLAGGELPSDYKTGLDEEQRNAYNWILRIIKQDHAISIKELDILFEAGEKDSIRDLWPQRTIHKKDLKPVVTEYATVSYRELFAESFAFHLTKRKLPESVNKLLEKSLSVAKVAQDRVE